MGLLEIILIILIIGAFSSIFWGGWPYGGPLGLVLLIVLLWILFGGD